MPTRHESKDETLCESDSDPLIIIRSTGKSVQSIQMGMLVRLSMVKNLERENIDNTKDLEDTRLILQACDRSNSVPHSTDLSSTDKA